jgi:hypothetical protein
LSISTKIAMGDAVFGLVLGDGTGQAWVVAARG